MQTGSRKSFIQSTALLLAGAAAGFSFDISKRKPLLSFSTLGCPDWTFQQIIDFAATNGYRGIELRGLLRQMDLTQCMEFATPNRLTDTINRMKEKQLQFVNLGSSCTLHIKDPVKRKDNLDEGRRFIDLAAQIQCPYVRVFPNNFPKDQDKQTTIDTIVQGLRILGDYASGKNVMVLMETHGDAVHADDIVNIMQAAGHPQVGLIWDVTNMWTITSASPAEVYPKIKQWVKHTHIKDAVMANGEPQYVFLGKGEVPIFEAINLLKQDGYNGFYSFEWEKLWHPELPAPELALADYPLSIKPQL